MATPLGDVRERGPFSQRGLVPRIVPYAVVASAALFVGAFNVRSEDAWLYAGVALSYLLLVLGAFLLPWDRLPRWTQSLLAMATLPLVGVLREATGDARSPFTALIYLPLMLFAMHGTRREVQACIAGIGVVLAAPLIGSGTASEWQRMALNTAIAGFIGLNVSAVVGRLRDSARQYGETEARAREARDQFVGLVEAATQFSIIATDASGAITVFNEGAARMLAYEPEDVIGRVPTFLHDPEELAARAAELDVPAGFEVLVAAARVGEADVRDWTYVRSTGERITVSVTVSAVRGPDAVPVGFIAIACDVTDERRNETKVREQAQRASLINELTHAIRQDLDPESVQRRAVTSLGDRLDADRVVIRLASEDDPVGVIAQSWVREGLPALVNSVAPPAGIARLSRRAHGDDTALVVFDVEDDARLRPGEAAELSEGYGIRGYLGCPMWVGSRLVGWLVVNTTRPRNWTGNEVAIVSAIARTVGAALLQAQTYQQELEIIRRLRELDQAKSDFVSSVSHELRTPLTSIIGYLEMLVEGDGGPLTVEQLQLAEVVERNSRRLLALIEDLLTLSHIEAGRTEPVAEPVDLAAVVADVQRTVVPILGARELEVVVDVPEDIGSVLGDAGQLERVLFNLVTNAVKFTPDGGRVSIVGAAVDGLARLSVSDSGIGIPEEEQEQLFTRFFRSSAARENAIQGTGLGLVIVKSIVEAHGGSISVASLVGVGTTVTVELPLLPVPADVVLA
ncbi:PAS domain-containing sensor histidine kinase [Sporichthya polymorpha]|uniref:PAS domain-containing sensor histidine kinase n=1 Tax=Sporichthya polymorpha TaxID=35751 RepID=UPI00037DA908|nr:ATP-binding protein [Sporichthya polymorpha]